MLGRRCIASGSGVAKAAAVVDETQPTISAGLGEAQEEVVRDVSEPLQWSSR